MTSTLVVVRPFAGHAKGDEITDAATVSQILGTEHAVNVVRVSAATSAPTQTTQVKQGG